MSQHRRTLIDQFGPPLRMQVVEGREGQPLVVEGKIGMCDKPTANNRMYPRSVMEREIKRLQPRIAQGSVIGAVDHPGDGKSRIREAGCIVRGLWIEANGEIKGRFEVVEEADAGRNLAAFLRRGAAIGMSSRGVGSTSMGSQGFDVVGEDFRLSTWDFVADPACHDAYPTVISEDVDPEGKKTGKLTVDPSTMTAVALREHFPDLVRSIEEHAMGIATETVEVDTQERLREQIEQEISAGVADSGESIREAIKLELATELRKELEEDFATKLVRALAEIRRDVTEEVRSEFNSDPENAQAKLQLQRVAEMVAPFTPTPDTAKMLSEKDTEIEELRNTVDDTHASLTQVQEERDRLNRKAKDLAYTVHIERKVAHRPDADELREAIGDVSQFSSAKELEERVESALAAADARMKRAVGLAGAHHDAERDQLEQRASRAERERDRARGELERFRTSTSAKLESLENQLTRVLDEQKNRSVTETAERQAVGRMAAESQRGALLAYAAKRTLGHPAATQIIEQVEQKTLTSKDAIDKRARELEENAEVPGGVAERMRRALSRGLEHPIEGDDHGGSSLAESYPVHNGEADQDLAFLGTSLQEQHDLAGRLRSRHDSRR